MTKRSLPEFLLLPNVFTESYCSRMLAVILKREETAAAGAMTVDGKQVVDTTRRNVKVISGLPKRDTEHYDAKIASLGDLFGLTLSAEYFPQGLIYRQSGKYDLHSDALTKDGRVANNRKLSAILYLSNTDSYTGGEFLLPKLGVTLNPPKGALLLFRSDSVMTYHQVNPVESGTRVALVNWFKSNG